MADLERIRSLASEILTHPTAQGHVVLCAQEILQALTEAEDAEVLLDEVANEEAIGGEA